MDTNHTLGDRGAVDLVSDLVRRAIAGAGQSSDIDTIVDRARAALVDADAVSLFGLETPHPDFGSVHWIVGRSERPGADFLVLAIPGRNGGGRDGAPGWPVYAAGSPDLDTALRQLVPDFIINPLLGRAEQPQAPARLPELLDA